MKAHATHRLLPTGLLSAFLLAGCHSYGVVKNERSQEIQPENAYSLISKDQGDRSSDILFILSFSGGGTRAAAMAYGVLEELRDTGISVDNRQRRLLDEVDYISSVSGGSFAAAYFGLHGDGIFDKFENEFLRFNLESKLVRSTLSPFHWFGRKGRTEYAIETYDKYLFHGATFSDMMDPGEPIIVINASDFSHGVRFSFTQEFFSFLCSDLSTFPVSRAVAASSAVPVVFNPVVVENYDGCPDRIALYEEQLLGRVSGDPELTALYNGLQTYSDKANRKYIHFVDGGITDNMGLRAMSDIVQLNGGLRAYLEREQIPIPRTVVLISVNASTKPNTEIDASTKQPSMATSIGLQSDVQLHRYNVATLKLAKNELETWAAELSTPDNPVTPYFIRVTFDNIEQPDLNLFLNKVPTSFSLSDEQVDRLIESARDLLRKEPNYQALIAQLNGSQHE